MAATVFERHTWIEAMKVQAGEEKELFDDAVGELCRESMSRGAVEGVANQAHGDPRVALDESCVGSAEDSAVDFADLLGVHRARPPATRRAVRGPLGEGAFDDLWLAPGGMAFGVLGQQRGCDELAGPHVGVEVHEGLVLHALGDELESSSRLLVR